MRFIGVNDHVIVLLLIFISGNPVLNNESTIKFSIPFAFSLVICYFKKNLNEKKFLKKFSILSLAFFICIFAQLIEFHEFGLAMIGIFVRLAIGAIVVYALGEKFAFIYFESIFLLAIISLIFYITQFFIDPSFYPNLDFLFAEDGHLRSIFIHTYIPTEPGRNSGIFWEPGAFQGFLNLAIMLLPVDILISKRVRLKALTIIGTIITTFSTTGFIVLFIVILLKIFTSGRINLPKVFLSLLVIVVSTIAYFSLNDLNNKIVDELDYTAKTDGFNPSRTGALIFDLHYILKRPLTGNGLLEVSRYADNPELIGMNLGHGNGFSDFIASMGLLSFFCYLMYIYRSDYFFKKTERLSFILFLVIILQGEHFLMLPLFLGLPFLRSEPEIFRVRL